MPSTKPRGPHELYVKTEGATPFTWAAFAATDALKTLTSSFGDSVRPRELIDEARGDRGSYAEVLGDYPEIPWSIETRFWGSGGAGTSVAARKALLEIAAGLDYGLYSTTVAIQVISFADGATDDFSVTVIDKDGTSVTTVVEEGAAADYEAAVSDDATATSLAAAINALAGVSAAAVTDTVTVTLAATYRDVDIPNPDAVFVTITSGDDKIMYTSDDANPAGAVSMYRVDSLGLFGEYLIGGICQQIVIDLGKESDPPKITYSGMAARKWEFMATTLGAEIVAAGTLAMTLANPKRLRTGTEATSETGLEIYAKIEDEIVKITAMNWTSGVAVIARAQFSTVAAAHANALAVTPYAETPTYAEAGEVMHPHDWTVNDGSAANYRSMQITIETGRLFDDLQSGSASRDAIKNAQTLVTGAFGYILDQGRSEYGRDKDAGTELVMAVTIDDASSTAGSIFTIDMRHVILIEPLPKDLPPNEVLEVSQSFRARDTATALAGAFQITMT